MGIEWKWLEKTNELDEVEGSIKDAVESLEKAVKNVVELRDVTRARGYPEDEKRELVCHYNPLVSSKTSSNLPLL